MVIPAVTHPSAASSSLPGQLYLYAAGRAAFESPLWPEIISSSSSSSSSSASPLRQQQRRRNNKCILLGGLSDGLLPVPYTHQLYEQAILPTQSWSLVQPILSSSYLGFGSGSLQRDTEELDELFQYLMMQQEEEEEEEQQQHGAGASAAAANQQQFGIVGHSTGCQNAVHYMKHGKYKDKLKVVALQAPASDREQPQQLQDDYATNIQLAQSMRDKADRGGEEMMPRRSFWAPITAQRFLDLQEFGGADDFFSSDYTDEQLAERLSHVGTQSDRKVLVAFSGADEYVPMEVVGDSRILLERLVLAMNAACPDHASAPVAKGLYLPTANHNLSEAAGDSDTFVQAFAELMQASDELL